MAFKKDRYGAIEIGFAVEKPKDKDKQYRFNGAIAKVYKKSMAEVIAKAIYDSFDYEEAMIDDKAVVQIRIAAVPYDEYQKLKRKAATHDKSNKKAKKG